MYVFTETLFFWKTEDKYLWKWKCTYEVTYWKILINNSQSKYINTITMQVGYFKNMKESHDPLLPPQYLPLFLPTD